MRNLLIDCDPGLDDAVALMLALRSPSLQLHAVTAVSGNLPADRTSANARKVLEFVGAVDIPVARGRLAPLYRPHPYDPFSHGDDGLGDTGLPEPTLEPAEIPASELIVETVNRHRGDISLACLGPLTNLALALELDPELPTKVTEVAITGGSFGFTQYAFTQATGDNPVSEWNIYVDPDAAQRVFRAGFPLTAVGLDVATHPAINLDDNDLRRLADSETPQAWFLRTVTEFVRRRHYQSYCALIDSLTVAHLVDETLVKTEEVGCDVETAGNLTRGMTVVDCRRHHQWNSLSRINAARDVDFRRFVDLLLETMAG